MERIKAAHKAKVVGLGAIHSDNEEWPAGIGMKGPGEKVRGQAKLIAEDVVSDWGDGSESESESEYSCSDSELEAWRE